MTGQLNELNAVLLFRRFDWELLFHVESGVKMTLSAVDGVTIPLWPGTVVEMDWPPVTDASAAACKLSVDSFFFYHSG